MITLVAGCCCLCLLGAYVLREKKEGYGQTALDRSTASQLPECCQNYITAGAAAANCYHHHRSLRMRLANGVALPTDCQFKYTGSRTYTGSVQKQNKKVVFFFSLTTRSARGVAVAVSAGWQRWQHEFVNDTVVTRCWHWRQYDLGRRKAEVACVGD